jgi:8-oxo-dGTP pyrophosphatase MutT (NUDIX family)
VPLSVSAASRLPSRLIRQDTLNYAQGPGLLANSYADYASRRVILESMSGYVTTGRAAEELGVSPSTLRNWVKAGLVKPAFRTPKRGDMRWNLDDLHHQLDQPGIAGPAGEPVHDPAAPVRPPVATAIITSKHGVLVERRHDGRPLWTFPAGDIEPGEAPIDAAIRETKEETTLAIVVSHTIGEREHPRTGRHMIYLAARPYQGTEVHNADENELAEVRWVSLAEAEKLLRWGEPDGMFEPVHEHLVNVLRQVRHRYSA